MNYELTEAHKIVSALAAIRSRLSPADVRFLASWETYLANAGDGAQVGRWRLTNLRHVAESYGIQAPEPARIGVADAPGYGLD